MRYFNPGFTVRPPIRTTWSNTDKSSNIVLTGGLLVATSNGAGDGAVRGTVVRNEGLYYCEINCTVITGGDSGAGLANTSAVLANLGIAAAGAFVQFRSGNVYRNGSPLFGNGGMSGGGILRVAYNQPAHLSWLAFAGGNFNGSPTSDPATATEGVDTSSFDTGGLFPVWLTSNNGDSGTLNAGASSFTYALPAGFSAWNG